MGDYKMVMDGYRCILNFLFLFDGECFMQLVRDMVKSYYEVNDVIFVINIIDEVFLKYQGLVFMEDVNIVVELYIFNKQYDKVLEVIIDFFGIVLEKKILEEGILEENKVFENVICIIFDGVLIDIIVKLMVCFVYFNIFELFNFFLIILVEQNFEDMGDLYLDVVEVFLDVGEYNFVFFFFSVFVCFERYNFVVVWFCYVECLKVLGYME